MKVGILFDLDGTLLDTLQDLHDAVNHTLRQYGCPERSLGEIRTFVGNGMKNLLLKSLPGLPADPDIDTFLESYRAYYDLHSQDKTCPYPGVLAALEQVRKDYPVAIVSNKQDSAVGPLCKAFFGDVYARGERPDCPRKPAADMLLRTMADIGVEACIYVGDSEVDILTAKNTGVPCLSVLWGFRDKDCLADAGGKHFCDAPEKLPQMLKSMIEEYYG